MSDRWKRGAAWWHRHELFIVSAITVAGMGLRLAGWTSLMPRLTETANVAVSLATNGTFADAFRPRSGPTAHVTPAIPLMIAGVYRLAGVGSPAAEFILCAISVSLIGIAIGLTYLLLRELGMGLAARTIALLLAALLPIEFALEVRELKVWEGPLAVAALTGILVLTVRLDRHPVLRMTQLLPPITVTALLALVSPAAALAGVLIVALLAVRRLPAVKRPVTAVLIVAALGVVLLPWALHNRAAMGRMVWLRSNGGLELALALNDTLYAGRDQQAAYLARLDEIHPMKPRGYAAMQAAGGELAYYAEVGIAAKRWTFDHPDRATTLIVRHVRQYVVPPVWFFYPFGGHSPSAPVRSMYLAATLLFALAGLPALVRRDRRFLYVAVSLAALMIPYFIVQPILRYRFLIYVLSVFMAVDVGAGLLTEVRTRLRAAKVAPTPPPLG